MLANWEEVSGGQTYSLGGKKMTLNFSHKTAPTIPVLRSEGA